jgi:small subunit ribosomal protein S5
MAEEKKQNNTPDNKQAKTPEAGAKKGKSTYAEKMRAKKGPKARNENKDEFEQRILDIARVTRVMAGGKRMSFRACVAVGDKKGKVGIALGKGSDVTIAINKAVKRAKQDLIEVPITDDTIPHEIFNKYGAGKLLFKPANAGKGIVAGGIVRTILELSGVKNVSSKILGTDNKVTNAKCAIDALSKLKKTSTAEEAKVAVASKEEKNK